MIENKIRHKNSVFLQFLISYIIILLVPILIGSVLYVNTLQLFKEEVIQSNMSMLEETREIINQRLDEVDNMVTRLAMNNKVKNLVFSNKSLKESEVYKLLDLERDLLPYALTNNFVSNFYIYARNSNLMISPYTSYSRLPTQYDYFFKYNNMEYDNWQEMILNHRWNKEILPAAPTNVGGNVKNMVVYLQSLPLEGIEELFGNIMVMIDEKEIQKLLNRLNTGKDGWSYILDSKGRVVTSVGKKQDNLYMLKIDTNVAKGSTEKYIYGNKITFTYTVSDTNGWAYVAAMPSSDVMEKVEYIKYFTLITTCIILLVGMLTAYFLSYRYSEPIHEMIKTFKEQFHMEIFNYRNEFDYIKNTITELVENNDNLKEAVQAQVPLLQAAFFDRLFKGEFTNQKEIELAISQIGLTLYSKKFVVIMLHINGYNSLMTKDILKEINMVRAILKEYFANVIQKRGYIHNMDENRMALFMSFWEDDAQNCINQVEQLTKYSYGDLECKYNIRITFSAGSIYHNMADVYKSFNEAREALNYKDSANVNGIIWFKSLPLNSKSYYYPLYLEARLINLVRAGNALGTEEMLKSIYLENFLNRRLSSNMVHQLFYEICASLTKALDSIEFEDKDVCLSIYTVVDTLDYCEKFSQTYECLIDAYKHLCNAINEKKKSHNGLLKYKMMEFVRASYADPELCILKVASEFDLTEVYLSQFFKEQTGENFSSFIENLRVEKACELLTNTDTDINCITAKIGYNSSTVFRRAFKRVMGVSPTVYRESI